MTCDNPHTDMVGVVNHFPPGQTVLARHKCVGCAYDQGFDHATNGQLPNFDPSNVLENQKPPFRHKDACVAYCRGYIFGREQLLQENRLKRTP